MKDPGLDLHEWETRWEQLYGEAADAPEETLPELVRLVEEMLVERGFALGEPVTREAEGDEMLRDFLAARDISARSGAGDVERDDVWVALENLREVHDYLTAYRSPP